MAGLNLGQVRCETCEGRGSYTRGLHSDWGPIPCPDCTDGWRPMTAEDVAAIPHDYLLSIDEAHRDANRFDRELIEEERER